MKRLTLILAVLLLASSADAQNVFTRKRMKADSLNYGTTLPIGAVRDSVAAVRTTANATLTAFPVVLGLACSDETTALTASDSVAKVSFRMPFAMTVTGLRASAVTCSTGDSIIVDIHEAGTSIMTNTKLHIDATEYTSTTAGVAYVLTETALADEAIITIFCDRIGSSVAGAGLKVWIIGTRSL